MVGFGFTHLFGHGLLPRLKNIGSARLYRRADGVSYPGLEPVLTRAINWDLIPQQYDQMIKYARALQLGTAEAEQILRRFNTRGPKHTPPSPRSKSWAARSGRRSSPTTSPTQDCAARSTRGLQVIEQWNSANVAIHYGRDAELPGADRQAQEISMLSLHLLQSALVLVNTRMVDRVLDDPDWAARLTKPDRRGLTPLFWSNVALHGTAQLDLDKRLRLRPRRRGHGGLRRPADGEARSGQRPSGPAHRSGSIASFPSKLHGRRSQVEDRSQRRDHASDDASGPVVAAGGKLYPLQCGHKYP